MTKKAELEPFDNSNDLGYLDEVSACDSCLSMTHTIQKGLIYVCGKCNAEKPEPKMTQDEVIDKLKAELADFKKECNRCIFLKEKEITFENCKKYCKELENRLSKSIPKARVNEAFNSIETQVCRSYKNSRIALGQGERTMRETIAEKCIKCKENYEQQLAEKDRITTESCMTITHHEKLMEECRNYYEKQLAEKETHQITPCRNSQFNNVNCLESEEKYGFFKDEIDVRPSSCIWIKKKEAVALYNSFVAEKDKQIKHYLELIKGMDIPKGKNYIIEMFEELLYKGKEKGQ